MGDPRSLILSTDLSSFFREEISGARDQLNIELSELTEFYLVNLLCEYSSRDNPVSAPGEEPLALIYKRSLEAPLDQRLQILKNLGDVALYVSGFFADFVERSMVDIDYYVSMGGSAYSNLSDLVGAKPRGETFAEVYLQLARRFTELVDLLAEISDRSRTNTDDDTELLKLYDRWVRTKSERVHKLLLERGLIPSEGLPTEYEQ